MLSVNSISRKEAKHSSTYCTESSCNSRHSKQMRNKDMATHVVKPPKKNSPRRKDLQCSQCCLQHSVLTFLVLVNVIAHSIQCSLIRAFHNSIAVFEIRRVFSLLYYICGSLSSWNQIMHLGFSIPYFLLIAINFQQNVIFLDLRFPVPCLSYFNPQVFLLFLS